MSTADLVTRRNDGENIVGSSGSTSGTDPVETGNSPVVSAENDEHDETWERSVVDGTLENDTGDMDPEPEAAELVHTVETGCHVNSANDGDAMKDDDIINVDCNEPGVRSGTSNRNERSNPSTSSKKGNQILPRAPMEFMRIGGRDKGLVGVEKVRTQKKLDKLDKVHRSHVVRVVKNLFIRTCKAFAPDDHEQLAFSFMNEIEYNSTMKETLMKCLKFCAARNV